MASDRERMRRKAITNQLISFEAINFEACSAVERGIFRWRNIFIFFRKRSPTKIGFARNRPTDGNQTTHSFRRCLKNPHDTEDATQYAMAVGIYEAKTNRAD